MLYTICIKNLVIIFGKNPILTNFYVKKFTKNSIKMTKNPTIFVNITKMKCEGFCMVKGVNRQVLEIHETGCEYFEKALFFVRPEFSRESESKLKSKAINSINNSTGIPKTRKQKIKSRVFLISELLASAGAGAVITALIIK